MSCGGAQDWGMACLVWSHHIINHIVIILLIIGLVAVSRSSKPGLSLLLYLMPCLAVHALSIV
jgi:hypothetical protein